MTATVSSYHTGDVGRVYLGSDKAEEVVIKNTNMIADMCDYIGPFVRTNVLPKSKMMPRCFELFGNPCSRDLRTNLPNLFLRLERELNSIIK